MTYNEKSKEQDAKMFAVVLARAKLCTNSVSFGSFLLNGVNGVKDRIQYNRDEAMDLLNNVHEYTFHTMSGDVQLSLQLYENVKSHYRLFAFTRSHNMNGMTFSVNLTTEKESANIIYLTQKLAFKEQYDGDSKIAQARRRQKQNLLSLVCKQIGLVVTDNNDLILGIFDPQTRQFVNTSADRFLNDFIAVALLKGHFQGNKGYDLDLLPSYRTVSIDAESTREIEMSIPKKVVSITSNRSIPLSLRYKVLKRDNNMCIACGRSAKDNVRLHVDHKKPYSLGGLTVLANLQTLCEECNIGKSNKYVE